MKLAVLLRDRVLLSTLAGEVPTGINHKNVGIRKPLLPLIKLSNNNISLGDSSVGVVPGDVDEVPTLVSPSLNNISPINHNCCRSNLFSSKSVSVGPAQSSERNVFRGSDHRQTSFKDISQLVFSKTINPVVSQTLKLDVSCYAVTRAHIVPLHELPQRKGLSPDHSMNKIKHVKGVCCVNSCLSVTPVFNVPNAVIEQSVGEGYRSLAGNGCKSSGGFCLERGLHPSIQTETHIDKVPSGSKWLRQSSKEPVLKRSLTQSHEQVGSRKGGCQVVPGILQPAFPCPQTKQKMEANLGPESVEFIPQYQYLQDGNPGDNPVILTDKGMGDIAGLQRRVFPHSNKSKVTNISEVFPVQSNLPIHSSSLWSGHSSS